MNHEAGRGGWVIISAQLADGMVLPMVMDTGAPVTLLDLSLRSKLGFRLDIGTIGSYRGLQPGGIYDAPKLYLEKVPLMYGSNVVVTDLSRLLSPFKPRVLGILGMDCLRHYCVQLDFDGEMVRFLDAGHLKPVPLGQAFPIHFAPDDEHMGIPIINEAGLLGGLPFRTVIDTGNNADGLAKESAIRHHAAGSYTGSWAKRTRHFLAVEGLVNRCVVLPRCTWAGNTYTNLAIGRGSGNLPNWIGIRFLARHLVTFDFPGKMLYLRQTRPGPLSP